MNLADLKSVLAIAHDLICSTLLFVIVIQQARMHYENISHLKQIEEQVRQRRLLVRKQHGNLRRR